MFVSRVHFMHVCLVSWSPYSQSICSFLLVQLGEVGGSSVTASALITTCQSNGSRAVGMQAPRLLEGCDPENQSSPLPTSCVKKEPEKGVNFPYHLFPILLLRQDVGFL